MRENIEFENKFDKVSTIEIADTKIGITTKEMNIIESLTLSQINVFKGEILENMNNVKKDVVGVRSEDLFFLLSCIQQNKLMMSGSRLMSKEKGHFYLTPNPESLAIQNQPQVLSGIQIKNFHETVEHNLRRHKYNRIALASAIYLNFVSNLSDQTQSMFEREIPQESSDIGICWENFFSGVEQEIEKAKKEKLGNPLKMPNRYPFLSVLSKHIDESILDKSWDFLKNLGCRGGVLLGFNEKVFENNQLFSRHASIHDEGYEVVVSIPSNQVEIDCLVGFEPLGVFEEKVIELINKRECFLEESQNI